MEIDSRRIRRLIERRSRVRERRLDRVVRSQGWLDPVADAIQKAVGAVYASTGGAGRAARNLMHGTTVLGHPLHPAVTDIPLGAWTVAVLADWLWVATGRVPAVAGDLALALGLAAATLAVISGYTDFHDTHGNERRTAILHGLTMTLVVALDIGSLAMRLATPGTRLTAILVSSIAWLMALVGSYVGGHVVFGIGTGVNHNAFFEGPSDYVRVGSRDDFPEGEMRRVEATGLPVVIVRMQGLLYGMGAVCAHAGGPLDEGKLDGGVVTCPWHASQFRFADGKVMSGPATFDQPQVLVRERGGAVEVKLARPLH